MGDPLEKKTIRECIYNRLCQNQSPSQGLLVHKIRISEILTS